MTMLTEKEMIDIQAFIDMQIGRAAALDLQVKIDDDLEKWRKLMSTAPGTVGASRTLDPLLNDIRPGNSFWMHLVDNQGKTIACMAHRFIETENFVEEYIATHRFFGNRCPSLRHYPVHFVESIPVLRGKINFGGGGWVHPEWRQNGLAGFLSRTSRILALRHFLIDYYIGFITATPNHRQYGHHRQGLLNRRHLLTGMYPGRDGEQDMDIYWMHRGEMMNQIYADMAQELDDVAPLTMRTA